MMSPEHYLNGQLISVFQLTLKALFDCLDVLVFGSCIDLQWRRMCSSGVACDFLDDRDGYQSLSILYCAKS